MSIVLVLGMPAAEPAPPPPSAEGAVAASHPAVAREFAIDFLAAFAPRRRPVSPLLRIQTENVC